MKITTMTLAVSLTVLAAGGVGAGHFTKKYDSPWHGIAIATSSEELLACGAGGVRGKLALNGPGTRGGFASTGTRGGFAPGGGGGTHGVTDFELAAGNGGVKG